MATNGATATTMISNILQTGSCAWVVEEENSVSIFIIRLFTLFLCTVIESDSSSVSVGVCLSVSAIRLFRLLLLLLNLVPLHLSSCCGNVYTFHRDGHKLTFATALSHFV